MGLNYYPRPRRAELDPPNIFVEEALPEFPYSDEYLTMEYTSEIETRVLDKLKKKRVGFPGRQAA